MDTTGTTGTTPCETIPYRKTRQGRLWHLSTGELARMRDTAYRRYCAAAAGAACTQDTLLTPREYVFALRAAQLRLKKFCADEKLGIDVNVWHPPLAMCSRFLAHRHRTHASSHQARPSHPHSHNKQSFVSSTSIHIIHTHTL